MQKTQIVFVRGMSCSGCARKVTDSLMSVEGVLDVDIDLETGSVTVKFNTCQTSVEHLELSIEAAGFQVAK